MLNANFTEFNITKGHRKPSSNKNIAINPVLTQLLLTDSETENDPPLCSKFIFLLSVRYEFLMVINIKITAFWDVMFHLVFDYWMFCMNVLTSP